MPFVTSAPPAGERPRVRSAGARRAPVVILHGSAAASSQLLSADTHKTSRGKSGSRGPSRERAKSAWATAAPGMPIPLTRMDNATPRSGFVERVEPETQTWHMWSYAPRKGLLFNRECFKRERECPFFFFSYFFTGCSNVLNFLFEFFFFGGFFSLSKKHCPEYDYCIKNS